MNQFVKITDQQTTRLWLEQLNGEAIVPEDLFNHEQHSQIVLGMKTDDQYAGLAYGIFRPGEGQFYLCYLFVAARYRQEVQVLQLIKAIFSEAVQQARAEQIIWNFILGEGQQPGHKKLLAKLDDYQIEEVRTVTQYGAPLEKLAQLRGYRQSAGERPEDFHCRLCCWSEYPEDLKALIRASEAEQPSDYLSPFVKSDQGSYDPAVSFVLADVADNRPLGWIICEQIDEQTVKLRRFYIYKEARHRILGLKFAVWVLQRLALDYRLLLFDVLPDNRQMQVFAGRYCRKALTVCRQGWTFYIKPNKMTRRN